MLSSFTVEQESMLAALYWPTKWASARNSKARYNLRKSAARRCVSEYYLTQGRTCVNCDHRRGKICELSSDFYGDVRITNLSDTCSAHKEK